MLRERHKPPAWAFLPQVRNGTGFAKDARTVDALAMSLFPSRGLTIHGFEIKVSRDDWFTELSKPEKSAEFIGICDHFWVVTPPGIVQPNEVPATWGHMVLKGRRFNVEKIAPPLTPALPDKLMLGAILRKAQECLVPEAKIEEAFQRGKIEGMELGNDLGKAASNRYEELKRRVTEFEEASGVHIDYGHQEWRETRDIGKAVRIVLGGKDAAIRDRLKTLQKQAHDIAERIDSVLNEETPEVIKA